MSKIATKGWRYARCGPISKVLKLESYEIQVSKDDVVVQVMKAPLHRVDSAIVNGSALVRNKVTARAFPRVGGSEGVGQVIRAGASKKVKEGDTVWIAPLTGTWAETVTCDANLVHKIDPKFADLATTASNFVVAQRLLNGYARLKTANDVIIQNGGSSLTALAISALAQEQKRAVFTAASVGSRFDAARERHKSFGSELFPYNAKGARAMREAIGQKNPQLYLNGVGGRSFNDFLKLVGSNANVVSYGAQNSFGLMWSCSNQIYKETTMSGFFLPRYLAATPYDERQTQLDFVLQCLASKGFSFPKEEAKGLESLPAIWDNTFVTGAAKGVLKL